MRFDLSSIKFSKFDRKRNIVLPAKMSGPLAEDIGIMIGDGSLGFYKRGKTTDYTIRCTGGMIDEVPYYKSHISCLKKSLFNADFAYTETRRDNSCCLKICSKGLMEFYNKIIGLPVGNKSAIGIPDGIFENKTFIRNCIRGLGDTDFSLVFKFRDKDVPYYPVIKIDTCSKKLIEDISSALIIIGFKPSTSYDLTRRHNITGKYFTTHALALYGKSNADRWAKMIGFSNPKNNIKYQFWKENDFGPSQKQICVILNNAYKH